MGYYAKLNNNNIVEQVIVSSSDVVQALEGRWIETFYNDPIKQYAGIGMGWNGTDFISQPFPSSTWNGSEWTIPTEMGIVGKVSPIFPANGTSFIPIYLIGTPNSEESIYINGEVLLVSTDSNGYGYFELSSATEGLLTVTWNEFTLEVYAYAI